MFVACSTLCFAREPLETALRQIAELEFDKFELALFEDGQHMRPSEAGDNPEAAQQRLRCGPSLIPSSLHIDFGPVDWSHTRDPQAVRRTVPAGQVAERRRADDARGPAGHADRRRGQAALDHSRAAPCAKAWCWPS